MFNTFERNFMNLSSFVRPGLAVAASSFPSLAFEHAQTTVSESPSHPQLFSGFTLWAAGSVQLGWDWAQGDREVIALFAPMSIYANVVLLDDDGCPLSDAKTIIALNARVRNLPWQGAVAQHVTAPPMRGRPRVVPGLLAA